MRFPEVNQMGVRGVQGGKEIRLADYRYPSSNAVLERRGIIYFIHGYGDYI